MKKVDLRKLFDDEGLELTEGEHELFKEAEERQDTPYVLWTQVKTSVYTAKLIQSALKSHSEALVRSANASDRYARQLSVATWVLAFATIVLAGATLVLLGR